MENSDPCNLASIVSEMTDKRSGKSTSRRNGKRHFLITGFPAKEKERLAAIIKRLGGEYIDERSFKEQCTHLICELPNRSEKFLGACATGTWILKNTYLDACSRARSWLPEETFEWTDVGVGDVKNPFLYRAPRRWREYVRQTKRLAFDSWRVILIIDDSNMRLVFRRLLEAGGAIAVISKLPPKVDRHVTHIFVKTKMSYDYFRPWKEQTVPCLAPDYIGDFLVEDKIPAFRSRDIFLAPNVVKNEKNLDAKRLDKDVSLTKSGEIDKKEAVKCVQIEVKVESEASSQASSICVTSGKETPIKTESRPSLSRNRCPNSPNEATKFQSSSNQVSGQQLLASNISSQAQSIKNSVVKLERVDSLNRNSESDSDDENKRKPYDENNNTINRMDSFLPIALRRVTRAPRVNYNKMHYGNITPTSDERKQNLVTRDYRTMVSSPTETETETVLSVESASSKSPLKRQCSQDANPAPLKRRRRYEDALMSLDQSSPCPTPTSYPPLPVSMCVEELFNTCYDEAYYHLALDEFQRYLCSTKHPTAEMICKMMSILFTSSDLKLSNEVYNSLRRLLALHPPRRSSLQACYLKSMQLEHHAWHFLTTVIETCKGENVDFVDDQTTGLDSNLSLRNSTLLLEYLATVFNLSQTYCESNSYERMVPLIANVLWTSADMGELNGRVRHLIRLVVDSTTSEENKNLRRLFYSLLISAFRAVQFTRKEIQLNAGKSEAFISELTRLLAPQTCSFTVLEKLIDGLSDTLLGIGVFSSALDTLDNIVFADRCNDVSLGKILGHYLFCIPNKMARSRPPLARLEYSNSVCSGPVTGLLHRTVIMNVNKRNMKGETKLHRACMKGDVTMVRQLLRVPGTDVNLQDYAGWTALHEACNAGHHECVQALLDYKPARTIDTYFATTANEALSRKRTVNLLLCDPDGTTPLHDAVSNRRVEVARLLVQYGGQLLLEQRNAKGQTALDIAHGDDMTEALTPPEDFDGQNNSQMDCSQLSTQSEDLNEVYTQTDSIHCTSVQECRRFLLLFECLLLSYLHVRELPTSSRNGSLTPRNTPEECYLKRIPRYIGKLRRHIQKIVVDAEATEFDAFSDIFDRLEIVAESYVYF